MGKHHKIEGGVYKETIFWWRLRIQKGGTLFGLVCRIMLLWKRRTKKLLYCVPFIINHLKETRVGGLIGNIWVSTFEAYDLVLDRELG